MRSFLQLTVLPLQDGSHAKRRMGLNREQMEAMNRVSLPGAGVHSAHGAQGEGPQRPRPTQLSLAPPSGSTSASASAATSPSPTPSTPADSGPARRTPRLTHLRMFPLSLSLHSPRVLSLTTLTNTYRA